MYKVKANDLIDQLSPWNVDRLNEEETNEKIDQLRACLDLVKVMCLTSYESVRK